MSLPRIIAVAVLVALGLIGYFWVYTIDERQQGLVLAFGEPIKVERQPGLHLKAWPWHNVVYMEDRILDFDAPKEEVIASDKKRIVVDAYARFRISDALSFYRAVGNEAVARSRLATIINSSLRKTLAEVELNAILSGERSQLMQNIAEAVNAEATKIGITIVDVRIMRADLPEENSQAIYRRMQAEREREAKEARARGAEEAQKIRADADRQKTVLLAEARKRSEILRGEGDAIRTKIYADAFGKDPEFFSFYRSLEAYRKSFGVGDTTMVLSPDSDFFRYFGDARGSASGQASRQ